MDLRLLVPVVLGLLLPMFTNEARGYPYEHHHEFIELTELSGDGYYTNRFRPQKPPDLVSIGIIILLLKVLFLKAKGLGIGLILLLKLPIILIAFLSKLLVAIKAFKLAKVFLLPLLIPLLLPLLLGPLLLLPLLLPLLLLLPIPVLAPTPAPSAGGGGQGCRRKREIPEGLHTLRAVIESEHCLERIACQMAASRQPSFYSSLIAWTLDKMKIFVSHPRFESYASAYDEARNSARPQKCSELYCCNNPNLSLF